MAESNPDPIHIIHDSRYARKDGWKIDDISLCSSGNIAVSGHNYDTDQSHVFIYSSIDDNSDSRDKPTLLYHKQFTHKPSWQRYISFIKPNSTEIVTCRDDEVQVIDYNRDVVLRSRKVNGDTTCVSVSENQIFIGLFMSDIVNIYDNDLNRIKSIRLKGIRDDFPWDIVAAADRLYVCTVRYGRAIVYSQYSGNILTEYTIGRDSSEACSIAVNIQLQIVAVLWYRKHVSVYSFSDNNCLVDINVVSRVTRIRISDRGRIVTGNEDSGEIKIYNLAKFFTFQNMKITMGNLLSERDAEELVNYFKINDDILQGDSGSREDSKKKSRLLTVLEGKGFLQDKKFCDLRQAFSHLGNYNTSMVMDHIDFYQKHTEKNANQDRQTCGSNKSGQNLQVAGFSADWSPSDMSVINQGNKVVVAGYCRDSKKTSLDSVCKGDLNSWHPWIKTREFEGMSDSERFVSFIDEHRVITCCDNVIEIINFGTNETEMKQTLSSSKAIATCITVRNGDIYIGFKRLAEILVFNRELQDQMTVALSDIESMWPVDLAAVAGKFVICLKDNNSSSKVFVFREENGQKLIEYRNVKNDTYSPQSVDVCEERDLVSILWSTNIEDYDGKPCGHITMHSLIHGYCLSLVVIAFTTHEVDCICNQGCSSGKKLQLTSEHVVVMDDLGGIKLINMKEVFSEENLSYVLSQTLSADDCKGFTEPENEVRSEDTNDSIDSSSHDTESGENENKEDGILRSLQKMRDLFNILTILKGKGHASSECVTSLKGKFSQVEEISTDDTAREEHAAGRDLVHCYRFQWNGVDHDDDSDDDYDEDSSNCMDVSFGSNNELAVRHIGQRTNIRSVFIYIWDKKKEMQPSLNFYRRFDDGSKLFISFLHGSQTVTCCDDLIEITDFDSHGKIINSHRLGSAATCMATKGGDIFVGFKSSEIDVFDSELVKKRSVTVKVRTREWPHDLAVTPGKIFMCTNGTSKRVVSLNLEDGKQLTEYTYNIIENYDGMYPLNITVSESLNLIGIVWHIIRETDWGYDRITDLVLYSLSRGTYVSIMDNHSAGIVRFSPDRYMFVVSRDGDTKYFNEDQVIPFDAWMSGFAHSFSPYECEMLITFYPLSVEEIMDNVDEEYLKDCNMMNIGKMKAALKILTAKGFISSTNVTDLRKAFAGLGKLYINRFTQPLDAYIKYATETCASVSVPSGGSNNVAETLLQLQYPSENQTNNGNSVCQQGNLSQSYPVAQPPSLGLVFPSLMGRDGASITESVDQGVGKRPYSKGDHFATDSRIHGKRLKVTDVESQTTRGTAMRSSISQALPGTATTALDACVLANQVISHEMPFSGEPSFLTLLQSPQPVPLDAVSPSNITQLNPSNELGQSRQLQAGQQMIHLERPARTESIATFNILQTPHIGHNLRTPSSHDGLPQPRNTTIQVSPSNPSSDMELLQRLTHSNYNSTQNREQTINTHKLQQAKQFLGNQPRSDPSQSFRQQAEHFEQQNNEKLVTFSQVLQQPNNISNNTFRENGESNHELPNVNEELQTEPASQQTDLSPSNDPQPDIPDGEIQAGMRTMECDSFETSIPQACEQMLATAQSPFQKHQAIVLKSIHEKLDCLAGSSKSCKWQETPGTQSHSLSKENVSRNGNECEQVAINYLESLPEEDKNLLLAFKDMNDDREELVRRLVEKMYTGEERKNGNTSGTGNFKKLDEDKLQKIRFTVFHLCPIRSRKQFTDKLQDKEWKQLCEVIDTANRHYRQELKRQSKRRHTQTSK